MVAAPGPVGRGLFLVAKAWLLVFPAAWYLIVERGTPSWSPPRRGGLALGAISGIVLATTIVLGFFVLGVDDRNVAPLHAAVREMGLGSPLPYLASAAGWIFVNSLMEEYVYRWFVLRQCEVLLPGPAAVVVSAGVFTAHHIIAVGQYLDPVLTIVASAGVFCGGTVWAWLYLRYRSIWPGWVSHAVVDVAVFGIGWYLLFG